MLVVILIDVDHFLVVAVVVVPLLARPRRDDASDLIVQIAETVLRVDHARIAVVVRIHSVVELELAAGDTSRECIEAFARMSVSVCGIVQAPGVQHIGAHFAAAGEVAVGQTSAVADKEPDHASRDGYRVAPPVFGIEAAVPCPAVCQCRDFCCFRGKIDIGVGDGAVDMYAGERADHQGVLDRP